MQHGAARNRSFCRVVGFFFVCWQAGCGNAWATDLPGLRATSADGRWTLVSDNFTRTLTLRDADQNPVRTYTLATRDGKTTSAAATLLVVPSRQSFVVALSTVAELWEISTNPDAAPIFEGLVHDYKMGEAIATAGFLGVRRTLLEQPFETAFVAVRSGQIVGALRKRTEDACTRLQVIHLDIRRRIGEFTLVGTPDLKASTSAESNDAVVLSVPDRINGQTNLVDMKTWTVLKTGLASTPGMLTHLACQP